ncbi:sel1 repeat family protein [Akkermansia glycaniphila]|uniref:SEL1-like repeat protein n=1 Tax=Akkermansia glycaniphila TaxID=1679444 RepID=UPI001C025DCE|nr:tetratricopeptide repeat protein [Akkermansia glycaniphila]MBT9450667.1 sel1 repeat family protein [Akkermansia glycaniphila]
MKTILLTLLGCGPALLHASEPGVPALLEEQADEWLAENALPEKGISPIELAYRYQHGIGVPRNVQKAIRMYVNHDSGIGITQFLLAICFHNGEIGPPDPELVDIFLEQSARQGLPHARAYRAILLLQNDTAPGNRAKALDLLEFISRQCTIREGQCIPSPFLLHELDRITETFILEHLQHTQDPVIQYLIGTLYMKGSCVAWDREKAVQWYEKSAMQGYARAQRNLGRCYLFGKGVQKNRAGAIYWYRKASEQLPNTLLDLAIILLHQTQTQSDLQEAVTLLHTAAENGNANAAYVLASLYADGRGVPKNMQAAAKWFLQATNMGPEEASIAMAYIYFTGDGAPIDRQAAVERMGHINTSDRFILPFTCAFMPEMAARAMQELRKEAETGDAAAQYSLGRILFYGIFQKRDVRQAIQWCLAAADQGHKDATLMMLEFSFEGKELTPARNTLLQEYFWETAKGHPRAARYLLLLTPKWAWKQKT